MRLDIDGLGVHVERWGSGPPVVLLHGFTGSSSGWADVAASFAPEFEVFAIDIVGHGQTDAPERLERYAMRRVVDDLAMTLRALGHERATWLGYSMGGRTALQVAVHRPDVVSALILEGATPGLATAEERTERVASDEVLAQKLLSEGVESFIDFWQEVSLFASQKRMPQERQDRVRAGRLRNRAIGLANSLRGMGTGSQEDVRDRLGGVGVPTFLITGALDTKFTGIAREMAERLPHATIAVIDDAGHAAHVERPAEFSALVLDFLRRVHTTGSSEATALSAGLGAS
ncbi:MAG: 2-succinyl-6-hydroxy-2,4-cyclohexadiene-1-carboxylate synthase [Dehalococcoidia bacterium]|nr:2-succinyl-6-hydroxy-2,4-cyclohexadiene-1-carboxylate synthase [Dehalococcoidia bacterium]